MRFDVGVPSGAIKHYESWVGEGHLHDFAVHAEACGFDSVHVTDHPFPENSWLGNGGHQAFDPFVALSVMAAVTERIKLRTNLLVAGYRHPYLMARSIASLDRLSDGRLVVGIGAGYLAAEFEVLSADFAGRGKRFDEAIEAMTAAWTGRPVQRLGGFYPAAGHTMAPTPVQQPRPPLWIGGNSPAARRRAAELADGWIPMPTTPALAEITGTDELRSSDQLAGWIAEIHRRRADAAVDGPFDVAFSAMAMPGPEAADGLMESAIEEYASIGVTWLSLGCRGRTLAACKEELSWLGEHVIAPHREATTGALAG